MKKILRIKFLLTLKQVFLVFALINSNIGSAQIKIENELIYNNGKSQYLFSRDGKFGIGADSTSVELRYDSVIVMHFNYSLAKVNGKWGTIDDNNKIRLDITYDDVVVTYHDGYLAAKKNGAYGLIYEDENILILPFEYDTIMSAKEYEVKNKKYRTFIVRENGKYGIVNNKNRVILPIEFDEISNWIEYGPDGHYVKKDDKWGFAGKNGNILIPCIYDKLSHDFGDKFLVRQREKLGVIGYDNQFFLPIDFLKIYNDAPFFSVDTTLSTRIVVQKIDSTWSYLSSEDGSVIIENVDKDSVFAKYKNEIFRKELMQAYLAKVKGGFSIELDTFSRNIVDYILLSKADVFIDFPNLHEEYINFSPRWNQIDSIFKIRNYLLLKGFKMRNSGITVDDRSQEKNVFIVAESADCECSLALTLYPTSGEDEYKMIESLKCAPRIKSKWEFQVTRYHDLE